MDTRRTIIVVAFASFCWVPFARSESRDDVVSRHKAAVASLQSLTCKIRIQDNYLQEKKYAAFTAEYSRFGDRVKCTTRTEDTTDVYLAEGGSAKIFMTRNTLGGKKAYAGAITLVNRYQFSSCEPWSCGLLSLSLPNTIEFVPLADLIAKAKTVTLSADEEVDGSPCAKISLVYECDETVCRGRWTVGIWFSRMNGMLVKKCTYDMKLPSGKQQLREDKVTEFAATPAGNWFPKSVKHTTHIDGGMHITRDVAFESVDEPQSMPNNTFTIKFHNRTPVTDHISHTFYDVDESGKKITTEKPLSVANLSSGSEASSTHRPRTDSDEEPRRFLHWIILGASLALLAGVALYIRRMRRHAATK